TTDIPLLPGWQRARAAGRREFGKLSCGVISLLLSGASGRSRFDREVRWILSPLCVKVNRPIYAPGILLQGRRVEIPGALVSEALDNRTHVELTQVLALFLSKDPEHVPRSDGQCLGSRRWHEASISCMIQEVLQIAHGIRICHKPSK